MADCRCPWHVAADRFCPVAHLNMREGVDRLKTFTIFTWPYQRNLSIVDMAEAGLYFTGRLDVVKCFLCRVQLNDWKSDDSPRDEHARLSPNCPFVLGQRTYNIPIIESPYKIRPDPVSHDFGCC